MDRRLELHEILVSILGSRSVYFQPPNNTQMQFPCITYQRDAAETKFAGNVPYLYQKRYSVTVIDRDPDSPIPDRIAALPMCSFNRFFTADGLNHDVFTLFF
jgi:hypothetical protein